MTLQRRVYRYLGGMIPLSALSPFFFSGYIHDADYQVQENISTAVMPSLRPVIL